jgi:AmmeMemoRadiSam system protein B
LKVNIFASSVSPKVRPPAAAGRFYPRDPEELREVVQALLAEAPRWEGAPPKALISPHAGYAYSGPIAASGYACLIPARKTIRRVILVGPAHFVEVPGLAASSAEAFATPLGQVPVDQESVRQLARFPQVTVRDDAHKFEHALEVQLPFLQVVLAEFSIVPLVVGNAIGLEVSQVLEALWGGAETLVIISSDLSHYLDHDTACAVDLTTAEAVEALAPERVGPERACGQVPIQGLLESARRHGLAARKLDLRNSGDTAGPADRVVGYGAFAFGEGSGGLA